MKPIAQSYPRAYGSTAPRQRWRLATRFACVLSITLLIHLWAVRLTQQQTASVWDTVPAAEPSVVQVQLFKPPSPITIGNKKASAANPDANNALAAVSTHEPSEQPATQEMTKPDTTAPTDASKPVNTQPTPKVPADATTFQPGASPDIDQAVVSFPKYGRLTYDTLGGFGLVRIQGETVTQWHVSNDRYEAMSRTTGPNGEVLLDVTSSGVVRPSVGIVPTRYTETYQNQSPGIVNFAWNQNKIRFTKTSKAAPLIEGTQDRLSFQAQLALLAQAFSQRFVPNAVIAMPVAGPHHVRVYDFHVTGWQAVRAQDGTIYDTLKLDRPMNPEHPDVRVEIWLAPSLNWLPVRVRITFASGYFGDSVLIKAQFDDS